MSLFRSRLKSECDRVREAASATLGLRPYDVQIRGGLEMHRGRIIEMATGEGKTLTALLPAYLQAIQGRPVLIATANDYLAQRDADLMRAAYLALGLSVGCVQSGQSRPDRAAAYGCDVTYGTAREFGFDFLRDRLESRRRHNSRLAMLASGPIRVQRDSGFLLLDEADSLLIDEARTPLILSGSLDRADAAQEACYLWAAEVAPELREGSHFQRDRFSTWPALTRAGRAQVRGWTMPSTMASLGLTEIHHALERALYVAHRFQRDRHYVVRDGHVQIVDEYTGRIQPGRTWNDGLHQAIEARERVPLTVETGHLARITMQEFVCRFPHIAGMTGTAREAAREFRSSYGVGVVPIPTHRPLRRERWTNAVFTTREEKEQAIVAEALQMRERCRAVLIGTPTIAASQRLSDHFASQDVEHVVLNALNPEVEAEIVAQAGAAGRVTIATNMAGRGTDIHLSTEVHQAGGLHVIATELHSAARIDRQLEGRCGRQGDPGTYRQFLSTEDEILTTAFGHVEADRIGRTLAHAADATRIASQLRSAQRHVEAEHHQQRQDLMQFDRELVRATEALGLDPVLDAIG
ncbi:MAG: DEAD/DEAH box helicase [Planctomycetaceae bacterium]